MNRFGTDRFDSSRFSNDRFSSDRFGGGRFGLPEETGSQFEAQLRPFVQEAKGERDREFNMLQPVGFIFDLLARGQYMSANLTDAIVDGVRHDIPAGEVLKNVGLGLWQGLTGKKKGSYADVLEKNIDDQSRLENRIFANRDEDKIFGKMQWTDLIGFAGDVLLDPTTYITFGATGAAKAVARQYADDAVRLFLKHPDNVARMAKSAGLKVDDFSKILNKGDTQVAALMKRLDGTDTARELSRVYKKALREGERLTAEKAATKMRSQYLDIQNPSQRQQVEKAVNEYLRKRLTNRANAGNLTQKEVANKMHELASSDHKWRLMDDVLDVLKGKTDLSEASLGVKKIIEGSDELLNVDIQNGVANLMEYRSVLDDTLGTTDLAKRYENMSERGMNFLGKELFKKVREPSFVRRSFDAIRDGIEKISNKAKLPGGRVSFADAWWSVMNSDKSPVGRLRKLLGFRNPYQKLVRVRERDSVAKFEEYLEHQGDELVSRLSKHDDAVKQQYVKLKAYAENKAEYFATNPRYQQAGDNALAVMEEDAFTFQDALRDYGVSGENAQKLMDLDEDMTGFLQQMFRKEQEWADEGILANFGERAEYMPFFYDSRRIKKGLNAEVGTSYAPFTKEKTKGLFHAAQIEKKRLMDMGMTAEQAEKVIWEQNASSLVTNLDHAMMNRVLLHARSYRRVQLLEQFREFGIHIDELKALDDKVADQIADPQIYEKMGLTDIDDTALQGYLFDRDVADVLARATDIVASDRDLAMFQRTFDKYTAWWKAVATMSPGFHGRNIMSDTITLFLRNGPRAFDPVARRDAIVASWYVLYGEGSLKKIPGMNEANITSLLNKRYGGHRLEDLARYARSNGILSRVTKGHDQLQTAEALLNKKATANPLSRNFAGFKVSESVGQITEGSSKMHNFLLEIEKMAGKDKTASDAMLEMAKVETKKWFIDYGDLTETERKFLKRTIPFYTWLRKNVANQIEMLLDPTMYGRLSVLPKGIDLLENEEAGVDPGIMPGYMIEGGYVPIGETDKGPVFVWPNIPIMDLNRIPVIFEDGGFGIHTSGKEVLSDIIQSSHPVIKTFVEQVTGYDTFRETPIKDQEKAPRIFGLVNQIPKAFMLFDGLNQRMGGEGIEIVRTDDDGMPVLSGRMVRLLENNLPILRQFERYLDGPEEVIGKIIRDDFEKYTTAVIGAPDKYEGYKETLNAISFWTGFKQAELDEEMARSFANQEIYEEAMQRRYKANRENPLSERRSREYWKNMKDRYRRLQMY